MNKKSMILAGLLLISCNTVNPNTEPSISPSTGSSPTPGSSPSVPADKELKLKLGNTHFVKDKIDFFSKDYTGLPNTYIDKSGNGVIVFGNSYSGYFRKIENFIPKGDLTKLGKGGDFSNPRVSLDSKGNGLIAWSSLLIRIGGATSSAYYQEIKNYQTVSDTTKISGTNYINYLADAVKLDNNGNGYLSINEVQGGIYHDAIMDYSLTKKIIEVSDYKVTDTTNSIKLFENISGKTNFYLAIEKFNESGSGYTVKHNTDGSLTITKFNKFQKEEEITRQKNINIEYKLRFSNDIKSISYDDSVDFFLSWKEDNKLKCLRVNGLDNFEASQPTQLLDNVQNYSLDINKDGNGIILFSQPDDPKVYLSVINKFKVSEEKKETDYIYKGILLAYPTLATDNKGLITWYENTEDPRILKLNITEFNLE